MAAHVAHTIAAKPNLVQISTAYGQQKEGGTTLPRNKYTEIRDEKPNGKDEAKRPEFKVCKFTTDAIVTDGAEVGTLRKVCANSTCPIHHPENRQNGRDEERWKAEQEKQRREQAVAHATGIRVLAAIGAAVPVRLMKRDLAFVVERLISLLGEPQIATLAKQHGIRQKRDDSGASKMVLAICVVPTKALSPGCWSRRPSCSWPHAPMVGTSSAMPPRFTRWTPMPFPAR